MALHGLSHVVVGVPDIGPVSRFYQDFGLDGETGPGVLASVDGGPQLRLVTAPTRRVIEIGVRAADPDDISRIRAGVVRYSCRGGLCLMATGCSNDH